MAAPIRCWAVDWPISSPFITPVGLRGRLAGWFMYWSNRQTELLSLLDVQTGDRVLEIGHGPGTLLRLLDRQTPAGGIQGIDPSPTMRDFATRTNRAAVRSGRIRLAGGSAENTGLPDASVDRAISVNNVALWPDLDTGIAELRRVLDPNGTLVLAWHGGRRLPVTKRNLRLPADRLDHLRERLAAHFPTVEHRQTAALDVFVAGS